MPEHLSDEDYTATQHHLTLISGIVADMPLVGLLNRIETSHAFGPILDPTLYRSAMDNLEALERIARAAREFQKVVLEVRDRG